MEISPRQLSQMAPRDRVELAGWLYLMLGIAVPPRTMCAAHDSPLDYLEHVFFERPGDAVVWANRGGGKTYYGAVATLLDLLFKPGIEVRILGGSHAQSYRMYDYLRGFVERPGLRHRVRGRVGMNGLTLDNDSHVELLSQAETSVRGHRVQKLRCDEVDLFEPEVWEAAQFVTRSARCGQVDVRGTVECFSTLHRPWGLMRELVGEEGGVAGAGRRVFKWCVLDVMKRCRRAIECEQCPLHYACGGKARSGRGFVPVSDVLDQQRRSSRPSFDSEMLCRRPSRRSLVYPMFDPAIHTGNLAVREGATWIGGMDFGVRSPLVMLWAQTWQDASGQTHVQVLDEYVQTDRTLAEHLRQMEARRWPMVRWVGIDPAGRARNEQTGISTAEVLHRAGHVVKTMTTRVSDGVELVRAYLQPADDRGPRLMIDRRCGELIDALGGYHFDDEDARNSNPVKDGFDHAADALRYMLTNLHRKSGWVTRAMW